MCIYVYVYFYIVSTSSSSSSFFMFVEMAIVSVAKHVQNSFISFSFSPPEKWKLNNNPWVTEKFKMFHDYVCTLCNIPRYVCMFANDTHCELKSETCAWWFSIKQK